jgi:predicted transcriptional regulator
MMIIQDGLCVSALDEFTHLAQAKFMSRLVVRVHDKVNLFWYKNETSVQEICNDMGISKHYVTKLLKELVDLGLLHKKTRGVYLINKKYFQSIESE